MMRALVYTIEFVIQSVDNDDDDDDDMLTIDGELKSRLNPKCFQFLLLLLL